MSNIVLSDKERLVNQVLLSLMKHFNGGYLKKNEVYISIRPLVREMLMSVNTKILKSFLLGVADRLQDEEKIT